MTYEEIVIASIATLLSVLSFVAGWWIGASRERAGRGAACAMAGVRPWSAMGGRR